MSTETNQAQGDQGNGAGEGKDADVVTVSKKDWENLNSTLGSLKRDLKDLQKPKEESATPKETSQTTEPSDLDYGQKALLRATLNIKGADELQLAKDYMKRAGVDADALEGDDIFMAKLDKLRTTKSNELAAQSTNGRGNTVSGRSTVEYWIAKGEHPPAELGRDLAYQYVQAKRNQGKNTKMFYNDK